MISTLAGRGESPKHGLQPRIEREGAEWLATSSSSQTRPDVGAVIRDRRKRLKLDQSTLAKRIGVSRQWVIDVEHGHPRAEVALLLRALDVLGIRWTPIVERLPAATSAVDINAIVTKAKKGKT
nr:helix-turn-helix domain-containing protein [Bradyrhizobium forestalis]